MSFISVKSDFNHIICVLTLNRGQKMLFYWFLSLNFVVPKDKR